MNVDPIGLVIMLSALSLLPMLLICTTCFLKVSMVLMIVRNAIGVQQVPPSIALYSIALAITIFVMAPTFTEIKEALPISSSRDFLQKPLTVDTLARAGEPLRRFMIKNTPIERRQHFLEIAKKQWGENYSKNVNDTDYMILIPAFVISEIQVAFEVGFVLYVPFVVIDLLISNLLLALGMQMVSPMVISLPLKILLFIILNGWLKLFEGLVESYQRGV